MSPPCPALHQAQESTCSAAILPKCQAWTERRKSAFTSKGRRDSSFPGSNQDHFWWRNPPNTHRDESKLERQRQELKESQAEQGDSKQAGAIHGEKSMTSGPRIRTVAFVAPNSSCITVIQPLAREQPGGEDLSHKGTAVLHSASPSYSYSDSA